MQPMKFCLIPRSADIMINLEAAGKTSTFRINHLTLMPSLVKGVRGMVSSTSTLMIYSMTTFLVVVLMNHLKVSQY